MTSASHSHDKPSGGLGAPGKTTLSDALRRTAESLREDRLSPGFEVALGRRLDAASSRPRRAGLRYLTWFGVVVAAAAAVFIGHAFEPGLARIEHQREMIVAPPLDETTWVEVDLLTGHHGGEHVLFHVEVPAGLLVGLSELRRRKAELSEASCQSGVCRFIVAHPPGGVVGAPISIGLSEPGSFALRITHHSSRARVSEAIHLVTRD
jgi:hypothetical protein